MCHQVAPLFLQILYESLGLYEPPLHYAVNFQMKEKTVKMSLFRAFKRYVVSVDCEFPIRTVLTRSFQLPSSCQLLVEVTMNLKKNSLFSTRWRYIYSNFIGLDEIVSTNPLSHSYDSKLSVKEKHIKNVTSTLWSALLNTR